jgi:hypothetical protein
MKIFILTFVVNSFGHIPVNRIAESYRNFVFNTVNLKPTALNMGR